MDCILTKPDKKRKLYKPTGWGMIVAILLTILYFGVIPTYLIPALWPKKIEDEQSFYLWAVFLNHSGIYLVCNVVMYFIYKVEWNFFERYKTHEFEWPWNVNKDAWITFMKRSLLIVAFNQFVVVPIVAFVSYKIKNQVPLRTDYESLPSVFEIVSQMAFCMLIEDFGFYWGHRILHWRPIYPYIHKIHHEYKNTISIASEHAHPIEFIIGNIIPVNLGTLILKRRCHLVTSMLWIIVRIIKTTEAHSGYQFTWSPIYYLPFQIPSDYHNFHHSVGFNNNFGSFFRIWDTLCNTTHPDYDKQVEERRKQQLEQSKED